MTDKTKLAEAVKKAQALVDHLRSLDSGSGEAKTIQTLIDALTPCEGAAMAAEVERLRGALRYLECPPFGDDDPDYGLKTREYAHTALSGGKEE